jgi:transposase-like protein
MTEVPYGGKRAKLTAKDKETVLTCFFNGEEFNVIAARVHCSVSNVYALTKRFRPISPSRSRNHPRIVHARREP